LAQGAPQIYNLPMLHRQMIEVLGVKNAAKLIPMQEDLKPIDPVSENMGILIGKPVKAFIMQDHDAHIAVHMGVLQDPKMMQMIGQNPQANALMAALHGHIMEHMAYKYRADIQRMLGANLPPPPADVQAGDSDSDDDVGYLDPQMEVQISQLTAQAAAKLLQQNQSEAQQQQAQQQAQDPILQMQQQELQLKAQELQLKQQQAQQQAQAAQMEAQLKAQMAQQELQLKQQEAQLKAQLAQQELQLKQQQLISEMGLQKEEIDRKARKDMIDAQRNEKQFNVNTMKDMQKARADSQHKTNEHNLKKADTALRHLGSMQDRSSNAQHKQADREAGMQKHSSTLSQQTRQAQLDRAHQVAQAANQPAKKEAE
jgi:hypothetical protein